MATNPAIKIMEPILGLGFIVHIIWSLIVSIQNLRARPVGYAVSQKSYSSSWASRNMLILGALIFVFLVMHIINFFYVIKFEPHSMGKVIVGGVEMEDTYNLVASLFKSSIIYNIAYIIGALLLGFHLAHGFWSAFHTVGFSNKIWLKRLQVIAKIYAIIVAAGFSIIPLYFLIKF
jgi:succinate dehydrogenase / fumarate reductase cytochrome b subunit